MKTFSSSEQTLVQVTYLQRFMQDLHNDNPYLMEHFSSRIISHINEDDDLEYTFLLNHFEIQMFLTESPDIIFTFYMCGDDMNDYDAGCIDGRDVVQALGMMLSAHRKDGKVGMYSLGETLYPERAEMRSKADAKAAVKEATKAAFKANISKQTAQHAVEHNAEFSADSIAKTIAEEAITEAIAEIAELEYTGVVLRATKSAEETTDQAT